MSFQTAEMSLADRAPVYTSGDCEIDIRRRELRVLGSPVPVGGRAFEIIVALVESAGELVTKDDLMNRIWPGAVVTDNTLQVHAMSLRKALGPHRSLLKTESGRGYRLLGGWAVKRHEATRPPVGLQGMRPDGESPLTNFPVPVTCLIGRRAAVGRLRDLASAYRVVTLTGPGGIGKTSLALKVARDIVGEFADGGWFVELAPLIDPGLVPSAVAHAIGLDLPGAEISPSSVARAIGRRRLLLVLDNCEHVLDAVAVLVEAVVRQCIDVTILTTSREILGVSGECVYRVPPLEVPAIDHSEVREVPEHSAPRLFITRARELDSDFESQSASLPTIAAICRHLDGIPLAIEFAAARAVSLGVHAVAAGLVDRFKILTAGRRTALPRHRTLRAALDWSYDLLTDGERALLCRLAIFPAGFTLDGAVAVGGEGELDRAAVIDGIASLIGKSLVTTDALEVGSRWRLLETIRSYALEKLAGCGDMHEAARRHAAHLRDFSIPIATDFGLRTSTIDVAAYVREIDNVRAALDWSFSPSGDVAIGIDLAAAYAPVWLNLSMMAECCDQCKRALHRLDSTQRSNSRLRMRLEIALGNALLHTLGPSEEAENTVTGALATAIALEDQDAQTRALLLLSSVYIYRGDYARGQAAIERYRQITDQISDPNVAAIADLRVGVRLMTLGRLVEARRSFEHAIQSPLSQAADRVPLWRGGGGAVLARASLARVLWLQGFAETAQREAQLSWDQAKRAPDQLGICRVLYYGIGRIAPMTGDFVVAENAIAQLIELASTINAPFWVTAGRFLRGKLLVERGAFAEGLAQLRDAFQVCEATGWRLSYPEFMGSLALALAGMGQCKDAHDAVNSAIAAAGGREDGQQWYVPELLRIQAETLLRQPPDRTGVVEKCLEQAATMAQEQGALTWELRIALSLARLRVTQCRERQAREVLLPVYKRFGEGFATTDLRAARVMLDVLPGLAC